MTDAAAGSFGTAEESFRKAHRLDAGDAQTLYYLGRARFSLGRFEASVQAFRAALARNASSWRSHRGMGLALEGAGRIREAEVHLVRAVDLAAGRARPDMDPRTDLGAFLFRQGRTAESIKILKRATEGHSQDSRTRLELGRSLLQTGRVEEARAHLEAAVRYEPSNWQAHLLLGKACYRSGLDELGRRHSKLGRRGALAETSPPPVSQ